MSLRLQAVRSIPWTAITTGSNVGARFLITLVAARTLAPFDLGLYAIVTLVLGIAYLFSDAGLSQGIIARQQAGERQLQSLYCANLMFGALIAAIFCLGAPLIAAFYGEPVLRGMLMLAALNFVIAPVGQVFQALLQKSLQFHLLGRIELAVNAANAAMAVTLLVAGVGVWALVISQVAAAALRSALLRIVGRGLVKVRMRLDLREIRPFLQFGMFQVGDRAINYIGSRLDQFLISTLLGPTALGYYNMAWMLVVDPVYRINPIITSVAFPVFARRQQDRGALRRGFLVVTKLLTTTNAPILLGFAAIAPGAIPLLLGEQWGPVVPLVELLSVTAIARTVNNPVGSLVLAVGRADKSFYWTIAQFAVQFPVYALLLAETGLIPATIFLCTLNCVAVLLVYLYLLRPILGPVLAEYARAFLPAIGLAAGMAVVVRSVSVLPMPSRLELLAIQLVLGAVLYCGLTLLLRRRDVKELASLMVPHG